jgi:hypothetical protein
MTEEIKPVLTEEKLDAIKRGLTDVPELLPTPEQKEGNLEGQKEKAIIDAEIEMKKEDVTA